MSRLSSEPQEFRAGASKVGINESTTKWQTVPEDTYVGGSWGGARTGKHSIGEGIT